MEGHCLHHQLRFEECKAACSDTYNMYVETFYPDHYLVLRVADSLIGVLINLEDYIDAERYVRICYECLTSRDNRNKGDPESIEVGDVCLSLARVTQKLIERNSKECGDVAEVEVLFRRALHSRNHCLKELSNFLVLKGNNDEEVKDLLERYLAVSIKNDAGIDSDDRIYANNNWLPTAIKCSKNSL